MNELRKTFEIHDNGTDWDSHYYFHEMARDALKGHLWVSAVVFSLKSGVRSSTGAQGPPPDAGGSLPALPFSPPVEAGSPEAPPLALLDIPAAEGARSAAESACSAAAGARNDALPSVDAGPAFDAAADAVPECSR